MCNLLRYWAASSAMTLRAKLTGYLPFVLWMFWPMIPVVIAGVIASCCGCEVDEGGIHPCVIFGKDIGETLSTMGMMVWLVPLTLLTGLIGLALHERGLIGSFRTAAQESKLSKSKELLGEGEFRCLGCGALIHREDASCRNCGWSWK